MFCRHCGSSMNPVSEEESNRNSVLILVWVVAVGVLSIASSLFVEFVDHWYTGSFRMFYIGIQIIQNIIMILPVLTIKNKALKVICLILMSMLILWWVYRNIAWVL